MILLVRSCGLLLQHLTDGDVVNLKSIWAHPQPSLSFLIGGARAPRSVGRCLSGHSSVQWPHHWHGRAVGWDPHGDLAW